MGIANWEDMVLGAYELGVGLGILENMAMDDFKKHINIADIEAGAKEIREKKEAVEKFYRSNGATDEFIDSRNEWIENYEIRSVGFRLLDIAQENKKAIDLDWKADFEEVFSAMKEVLPGMTKGDDEEAFRESDVEGMVRIFSQREEQLLEGKKFVKYETYGDNVGFLYVDVQGFGKYKENLYVKFLG